MPEDPRHRVIALGASNLTRGFLSFVDVARSSARGPVDVVAAVGRGRSYGIRSRLLVRSLPSIEESGLWPALSSAPRLPATALVMDVGNDILYGVDVATLLGWVDHALARLAPHADQLLVGGLPLQSIRAIGPARFAVARSILVPSCRLSLAEVRDRAERVEDGLRQLASRHGAGFRELIPEWYGIDPMHFGRRHRRAAFAHLLDMPEAAIVAPLDDALSRARFLAARPERRSWLGREVRTPQPSCLWKDGSRAALF